MNNINFLYFLNILLFCFTLKSCSSDPNGTFELPQDVHLKSYGQFDPILADYLMESPFKQPFFWNDSLVSLCNIKKIEIVRKGNKKPDDIAERIEYLFDLSGRATSFYFYNYELSNDLYSEVKFIHNKQDRSKLESPVFLGKKTKQYMDILPQDKCTLFVRKKSGNDGDSTFLYHQNGLPTLRIEKLGTFVSKVQFYLPANKPFTVLKDLLRESGMSEEDFLLAEKTVTFTENNIPQRSFYLNENFIKGDLTEEWFYGNFGELEAYKKYINNTCVKDMKFYYSKDKLLRSFENNRLKYDVNYQ